jgi:MFS family permease
VAASIWALFLGVLLLMVGNGLLGSILGVRADLEGFETTTIGLVMAAYYVGFLLGSLTIPARLASVGHVRVFAGLASLASASALCHALVVDAWSWSLLRFVTGLCLSGLYVTIESWLNGRATNVTRGRLLSIYMVVVTVGIAGGQLLLGVADPLGPGLFIGTALLLSLAVVPLAFSQIPAPAIAVASGLSVRVLAAAAPLGAVTAVLVGASNSAIFGLGAVYATKIGMTPGRAGLFVGSSMIGAILTQYPLGHLSDRFPRRRVISVVAAGAVGTAMVGTVVGTGGFALFLVAAVYGSLAFPMYSLAVSHINDVVHDDQLVATAAGVLFLYGVGSVAGPIIASVMMTILGPVGYLWSLAGFFAPVAVYSVFRMLTHGRPRQQPFVNVPASTAVASVTVFDDREPTR